jgi:hypothetical protein
MMDATIAKISANFWETLRKAQLALADEITLNPDKTWRSTLIERYRRFLADRGQTGPIASLDAWIEGSAELTEAVLRSAGLTHNMEKNMPGENDEGKNEAAPAAAPATEAPPAPAAADEAPPAECAEEPTPENDPVEPTGD